MGIKNKKFRIGDLVTRVYRSSIGDEIDAANAPYGIVLEIQRSTLRHGTPNILVCWYKDFQLDPYKTKTRLNNARFLRLISRAV